MAGQSVSPGSRLSWVTKLADIAPRRQNRLIFMLTEGRPSHHREGEREGRGFRGSLVPAGDRSTRAAGGQAEFHFHPEGWQSRQIQAASSVFFTTGAMLTPRACMIFMMVANSGLVSPLNAR